MRRVFVELHRALKPIESSPGGNRLIVLIYFLVAIVIAGILSVPFGHFGQIFLGAFAVVFVGGFFLSAWGNAGDQWGYSSDGFVDEQTAAEDNVKVSDV